jgi:hypothetical protein
MTKEFLIGLVFLTATAFVGFFTATVHNWNPFREPFILYIDFNRVNDLSTNNDVTYEGLRVGYVQGIEQIRIQGQEKIRVTISLDQYTDIPRNANINIQDRTVLGGKKINISRPLDPRPPVKNGHVFTGIDPDALIKEAGTTLKSIGESFDEVKSLILDIKEGKGTMGRLFTDPSLYDNFNKIGENVNEITDKINKGDGTLGKLVNDSELYDDARDVFRKFTKTHVDLLGQSRIFPEDNYSLTNLSLKITTSEKKFYVAGADFLSTNHQTEIATARAIAKQEDSFIYPTVLVGRRYLEGNNLEVSAGLIEGELGGRSSLALTLPNHDRLWLHIEARNRIRDKYIHENNSTVMARFYLEYEKKLSNFPNLKINLGLHNLIDDTQGFFGFGFEFRDNDLKYLVGVLGSGT